MELSLGHIAARYGCELQGDPEVTVTHVASLADAGDKALTFVASASYRELLPTSRAGAVIVMPVDAEHCSVPALISTNPYLVYAQVASELHPPAPVCPGIHPSAVVHPAAEVPPSCEIGPGVVIGAGARLGERVWAGPNATLAEGCEIGDDTKIHAGVVICRDVRLGRRCIMHPGVVIGADGFGNARDGGGAWVKVPQLGAVIVGDDVEIGANTTVDRGAIGDTQIEDGVRIDNLVQVGHNVRIGAHTAIASQVGISGSTQIGARCMVGGKAGFAGHITVADDVVISAATAVTGSIRKPGVYGGPATTADDVARWRRNAARYRQLDDMASRLRRLEKQLAELDSDD
ncbi:MAG TPA: UDP-3-O-(3-hydroxymyristoyl)glucosamine N-acyltransferase [Chromatiales bacterium]|nr:UDP-3-O-(3-hydroxymyristoyl)glucosamine N-acyltransferase [Chromatiales bacterium]